MDKAFEMRYPTKPGAEQGKAVSKKIRASMGEGQFGGFPLNRISQLEDSSVWFEVGRHSYPSNIVSETKDGTSTIAIAAAGLVMTGSADTDDVTIRSVQTWTAASDKLYFAHARVKLEDVDKIGLTFGFGTSGTAEYFTAVPADGVYLFSAHNAATLIGKVCENTNAADDSGTLATLVDDTEVLIGVVFDDNNGWWYVNGTKTAFTADQKTALAAMFATTAPTLCFQMGMRQNGAGALKTTWQWAVGCVER
jgi:hypothetical protein